MRSARAQRLRFLATRLERIIVSNNADRLTIADVIKDLRSEADLLEKL